MISALLQYSPESTAAGSVCLLRGHRAGVEGRSGGNWDTEALRLAAKVGPLLLGSRVSLSLTTHSWGARRGGERHPDWPGAVTPQASRGRIL